MIEKKIFAFVNWQLRKIDEKELQNLLKISPKDYFVWKSPDWEIEFRTFDYPSIKIMLQNLLTRNRIRMLNLFEKLQLLSYWAVVLVIVIMSFFIYRLYDNNKVLSYTVANLNKTIDKIKIQDKKIDNIVNWVNNINNNLKNYDIIFKKEDIINNLLYKKFYKEIRQK